MKNYDPDKREIKAFINEGLKDLISSGPSDFSDTLRLFTEETDDDFLNERSKFLKEEIKADQTLADAFHKLADFCEKGNADCENCPVKKYCCSYINRAREKGRKCRLGIADLFCGAGGLSLGFNQAGFVTRFANDIQSVCIDTYAHNHPETPRKKILCGDIREITDHIEKYTDGSKIDVVIGGPPCQGFSSANRQRLIDDPRNHLYKSFVETVAQIRPPFFVMENVRGMLTVANQVKEDFEKIGYKVEFHILKAQDYGIPQNRLRLIYIGNRIGVDNSRIFNEIINKGIVTPHYVLGDALYGLRPLQASRIKNATWKESEENGRWIEKTRCKQPNDYMNYINGNRKYDLVLNHKARYNNDRDIEIFSRLNPGDNSTDAKIADIMPYASRNDIFKDKYYKLNASKICKTITAHMSYDCNMYIHPSQARGLTPREAARVQSYPDEYFFRGAFTKTYMQIGNSVPPVLGRVIAEVIKKYI